MTLLVGMYDLLATITVRFVDALAVGVGVVLIASVLFATICGPTYAVQLLAGLLRRRDPLEADPEVRARRVMAAGYAEIERQRGRAL